jgi:methionyl-tRNA formyltransferase
MKIIFFGSTPFAVPIVQKIKDDHELLAVVITKPKPRGRGLKTELPDVAVWAEREGISVLSSDNPNEEHFIHDVDRLEPDIYVLSAYGHILSGALLKIPRLGGINIHPSLLPKYRGAAPIQRTLMAGERKTGITIFFMDEKIDHGDIVCQKEIPIDPDDTYGTLARRLSMLAAETIGDVLRSVESGTITRVKQDEAEKIYASKIQKEEMRIDWQRGTEQIFNLIRALSPSPGARTTFRGKELKILEARRADKQIPASILHIENKTVYAGTGDGSIVLQVVQPENRSKISGLDFMNGFRIKEGERLV